MAPSSDRDQDPKDPKPPADNPFIKFRQFADAQIGSLLQGVIGLPSALSKNPSGNARWADFDDELRRRDELQARQKELKESEARRKHEQEAEIPIKKSCGRGSSCATRKEPPTSYQPRDENMGPDIPLYSPVTKSLFNQLLQADTGVDWNQSHRINSVRDVFRKEYFPFTVRQDQKPSNDMEALQFMAYNELDGSSLFRSDYSLLPYLLFSPYSPIRLQADASKNWMTTDARNVLGSSAPIDSFQYDIAFEDLIRTSQGSSGSPFPRRSFKFPSFSHSFSTVGTRQSISWMAWIHSLYGENHLQQREVQNYPLLADMIPASAFSSPKTNSTTREGSEDAQTEQDMYDRFLRWASTPSALAGALDALDSLCTDTEGFVEKQLRALESPEGKQGVKATVDSGLANSKFGKDMREALELFERSEKEQSRSTQNQAKVLQETSSKKSQDPDKVVSTSTTTSHTTHEDGSVETCVSVWKRYADGRESVTETNHYEDPTSDEDGGPSPRRESAISEQSVEKAEAKKGENKGWFWN